MFIYNENKIHDTLYRENAVFHHIASRRGYESRKGCGHLEPYSGKYGNGFIWVEPRFDTTRYVSVTYYIKREV